MNRGRGCLATGFFSGYVPFAPGYGGHGCGDGSVPGGLLPGAGVRCAGVVCISDPGNIGCVYTASAGEEAWGPDPGPVVIDEFAGFYITVAFLPLSPGMGVAGFFIFRYAGYHKTAACPGLREVAWRVGRGDGRRDRGRIRKSAAPYSALSVERVDGDPSRICGRRTPCVCNPRIQGRPGNVSRISKGGKMGSARGHAPYAQVPGDVESTAVRALW